jgi:hypothetical protein
MRKQSTPSIYDAIQELIDRECRRAGKQKQKNHLLCPSNVCDTQAQVHFSREVELTELFIAQLGVEDPIGKQLEPYLLRQSNNLSETLTPYWQRSASLRAQGLQIGDLVPDMAITDDEGIYFAVFHGVRSDPLGLTRGGIESPFTKEEYVKASLDFIRETCMRHHVSFDIW